MKSIIYPLLLLAVLVSGCESLPESTLEEDSPSPSVTETNDVPTLSEDVSESGPGINIPENVSENPSFAMESSAANTEKVIFSDQPNALPSFIVDEFTVNKDMTLGTVLRALARLADMNIAFGDSVESLGPFRFRLNNPTPWDEVLESILSVYHLTYDLHGKIITIMTIEDMDKRYSLEKKKNEQLSLKMQQESMSPLGLQVVKVNYVPAETLLEPLKKLLSRASQENESETRGSISLDKSNNNLIINASAAEMEKILNLLAIIDRKTRQIRIEATLVEVNSQLAYELGMKWSFHRNQSLRGPEETRGDAEISPMSMNNEGEFSLSDATYNSMQGIANITEGTIDYGIIGRNFALGLNLKALAEDGKVKILSRPSLSTMDNQSALIKSGSDVPFQTQDENGRPVVEYKEAVLSLDVLPHIVDDNAISLDVSITKDEPDFTQSVDGNPLVIKKLIKTRMLVLDGQTAVIAGLSKNSQSNRDGGIPYLRKIPLLGRLFSSKLKQNDGEELMIFLTPRIIPDAAIDNSEAVEEWMDRLYYGADQPTAKQELQKTSLLRVDGMPPSQELNQETE